jgi:hypothetical protein
VNLIAFFALKHLEDMAALECTFRMLNAETQVMYASDYPHWDFDDPFRAFPAGLPPERHKQILTANGRAVFRLG